MFSSFLQTLKALFSGPRIITQYEDMILQEEAKKLANVNPQITDTVTQVPVKPKRTKKTLTNGDTPKPRKTKKPKE